MKTSRLRLSLLLCLTAGSLPLLAQKTGPGEADFEMAVLAASNVDPEATALHMRRAAEAGHPEAVFQLGALYEQGYGVPQDDIEAARWFKRAADLGHAQADPKLKALRDAGRGIMDQAAMQKEAADSAIWLKHTQALAKAAAEAVVPAPKAASPAPRPATPAASPRPAAATAKTTAAPDVPASRAAYQQELAKAGQQPDPHKARGLAFRNYFRALTSGGMTPAEAANATRADFQALGKYGADSLYHAFPSGQAALFRDFLTQAQKDEVVAIGRAIIAKAEAEKAGPRPASAAPTPPPTSWSTPAVRPATTAANGPPSLFTTGGKYGIMNAARQVTTSARYEMAQNPNSWGFVMAKLNGKWGLVDGRGREIIPHVYDSMFGSTNPGLFMVTQGDSYFTMEVDQAGRSRRVGSVSSSAKPAPAASDSQATLSRLMLAAHDAASANDLDKAARLSTEALALARQPGNGKQLQLILELRQIVAEELARESMAALDAKDTTRMLARLEMAANLDYPPAAYMLGAAYVQGVGVTPHFATARQWYQKAADLGHQEAKDALAKLPASTGPDADLQATLAGLVHATHRAVTAKDLDKAVQNSTTALALAQRLGNETQLKSIMDMRLLVADELMADAMAAHQAEDTDRMFARMKVAAGMDHPFATYMMGLAYEEGVGVDLDVATARQWYQKAADLGHKDAKTALAKLPAL